MKKRNRLNFSCHTFIYKIIISVLILLLICLSIYTYNLKNSLNNTSIIDNYTEEQMLELFSNSSDIRIDSIHKISDDKFIITADYYERTTISPAEYNIMVQNNKITIDNIVYNYNSNNSEKSAYGEYYGTIKSTINDSDAYYVLNFFDKYEYEFQSINGHGYDDPLTNFCRTFQYEVTGEYTLRMYISENEQNIKLNDLTVKQLNYLCKNYNLSISRGRKAHSSEIVVLKK